MHYDHVKHYAFRVSRMISHYPPDRKSIYRGPFDLGFSWRVTLTQSICGLLNLNFKGRRESFYDSDFISYAKFLMTG